jgi:hypothetical protein
MQFPLLVHWGFCLLIEVLRTLNFTGTGIGVLTAAPAIKPLGSVVQEA